LLPAHNGTLGLGAPAGSLFALEIILPPGEVGNGAGDGAGDEPDCGLPPESCK